MRANPIAPAFGAMLKQWRVAKGVSQLDLAHDAEVSTRHISFIENARSRPSREMVLLLSSALDIPLRARNAMLGAAGFTPAYSETDFFSPELEEVRQALTLLIESQEPFPAVVVDRAWRLRMANQSAMRHFAFFGAPVGETDDVMEMIFRPDGVRRFIINFDEVAREILHRLQREAAEEQGQGVVSSLLKKILAYPDLPALKGMEGLQQPLRMLIPLHLRRDDVELRLLSTISTFGTAQDVTLQELRIETWLPADEASREVTKKLAAMG